MIEKPFPTRAEVNDIFNALELGADNLVLAAKPQWKISKRVHYLFRKNNKNF